MFWFCFALLGFFILQTHRLVPVINNFLEGYLGKELYAKIVWILTFVSLFGIVFFYNLSRSFIVWPVVYGSYTLTNSVMMLVCLLLVITVNPSNLLLYVGSPFLWSVFLFSLVHLFSNGDIVSILAFSVFLVLSIIHLLAGSENRKLKNPVVITYDIIAVVFAIILYLALMQLHALYAGVAVVWG